jgi:transposase
MRYELSDYEWTAIKPMLPNKPCGVRRVNDRRVLNGIFWVLRSGAPWHDLPVADTNGLPVHLALTPGEAHDNRLCSVLLTPCFHKRCCSRIVDTTRTGSASLPARRSMGKHSAEAKSQRPDLL